jgi:sulfhydrogenase subunit beta (sulfur reductase)
LASIIESCDFGRLFEVLATHGYQVMGPTRRGDAIVYEEIDGVESLPAGWGDELGAGHYRLEERGDGAFFGYTLSPQSWKRFLHPPRRKLWSVDREGMEWMACQEPPPPTALLGVRACELRGMEVQDRVFQGGDHPDPDYRARRESSLVVAVNCTRAGDTCFCTSMNTGPRAAGGFDLLLTEIVAEGRHHFVVETGSERGEAIAAELPLRPAGAEEVAEVDSAVEQAGREMGRELRTEGLPELMAKNLEHPNWEAVASRCLSCANCTLVCPTCFCTDVEDTTSLDGSQAERWQHWDSCFTMDFSYLHGGSVRSSTGARYRQWITHKLSTWHDQFGESGCVGCGRCITWCPVGIDITEEVAKLRADAGEK